MQTPRSSKYAFLELISEHSQFQAWRATNVASGEPCFIKYTPGGLSIVNSDLVAMQIAGVRLQHRIRSARVAKARSYHLEGKDLYVEYPFLDQQRWCRLTQELFWSAPERLLTEMCLTIDYLHQLGLVHGDIKLDNFLLSCKREFELKLIDLDFLSQEYTRPKAKLFGTPDHIAPEIEGNNIVAPQSDNFSLGVSLGKAVGWLREHGADIGVPSGWVDRLSGLVETLKHPDYVQRPFELLAACRRFELVDETNYQDAMRRLLAAYMLSRVSWPGYLRSRSSEQIGQELRGKHRVFGIQTDLLAVIQESMKRNASDTFQAIKKLVSGAFVERQEKFFCVNISDSDAWALLRGCRPVNDAISGKAPGVDGIAVFLEQAKSLVDGQMPYIAYLLLKHVMAHASLDENSMEAIPLYRSLAELAKRLNRVAEVYAFYDRVVQIQKAHGVLQLDAAVDGAVAAIRINRIDDAYALTQEAKKVTIGSEHDRLNLLRQEGWVQQLRGNYRQAEELLCHVVDEADQQSLTDLRIVTRYGLAVIAWRQADSKRALALLTKAYRLSKSLNWSSELTVILSMLALIYSQAGRYQKSIRAAKVAIRSATPDQVRLLYFVHDTLIGAYVRIAKFEKARYWLQEYMSNRQVEGGDQLLAYAGNLGHVEMEASRLREAAAVLGPLSTHPSLLTDQMALGKVCQSLAMVELRRGRFGQCLQYVGRARVALAARHDAASLKELDLLELMAEAQFPAATNVQQLVVLAKHLQQLNSSHYASLALYWALLANPAEASNGAPKELRQLVSHRESRPVPLFSAIRVILDCFDDDKVQLQQEIAGWKSAYLVLLRGRQIHLALHTAIRLSQLYAQGNHPRHAHKYWVHARSLANSLENEAIQDWLNQQTAAQGTASVDQMRLVESYLSISEILRDIGDYQQAMRRVLAFAVEQTGAERGILFLKRKDREEFQVGAAVNCDEQSIEELSDFSSHLPWLSTQEQVPLLIENAVQDRRTNKYQSVIQHNILSVACVPLRDNQELRGVLYLDHHTIPSLFELEDIRYLMSLANFLTLILTTAATWRSITLTNAQLRDELSRLGSPRLLVTEDPVMLQMLETVPQIARTSASVLIQGESGTGKEILADLIHRYSLRASEPLIKLNCATLAPTLLESELFGIAKNVATGVAERDGKFAAADGGTLFLDEIGDMPLDIQAKVLRAIEYQQFEKVGSNRPIRTDIRFLYATNKNIAELVAQNKFRQDLYYRINTIALDVPPLRQRPGDIPLLLDHFLTLLSRGSKLPKFSPDALDALMRYRWPGNVRQLRNLVDRCIILHPAALICQSMLPREILEELSGNEDAKHVHENSENAAIVAALKEAHFDLARAARLLSISLSTLRRRMKKYGLGRQ